MGQTDVSLGQEGIRQAEQWAGILKPGMFDAVFSSPLKRCRVTAGVINEALKAPMIMMDGLAEINLGAWEGLSRAEVNAHFPGEWAKRGADMAHYRPQGGESFTDLRERVAPVLNRIMGGNHEHILVVTHAGVIRVALCHYLGMPLENLMRIHVDYGAMSRVEFHDGAPRMTFINKGPRG